MDNQGIDDMLEAELRRKQEVLKFRDDRIKELQNCSNEDLNGDLVTSCNHIITEEVLSSLLNLGKELKAIDERIFQIKLNMGTTPDKQNEPEKK